MPWYLCQYPAFPADPITDDTEGNYSSFIWARSRKDAERLAKVRRMGERVLCCWQRKGRDPYRRPSDQLRRRKMTTRERFDAIHGLVFLSYILLRSRRATPEHILGDHGILHEAVHNLTFGCAPRRRELIEAVAGFERMAPGYCRGAQ